MFKESALANVFILFAPLVIPLLTVMFLPGAMKNPGVYVAAALDFYGVGFVSFAAAKIQNIRKGHLLSFGSSRMLTPWKWAYRIGYTLMMIGLLLIMAVLVGSKFNA